MRVLIDTGVFISAIDRQDEVRAKKAKYLFDFLVEKEVVIMYSERTLMELCKFSSEKRERFIQQFQIAKYFIGNEIWDEIDGTWSNCSSAFGDEQEFDISVKLNSWLPKIKDIKDRGIILDAVYNNCDLIIHENPRDFNKVPEAFFREFGLKPINLLSLEEVECYFVNQIFSS